MRRRTRQCFWNTKPVCWRRCWRSARLPPPCICAPRQSSSPPLIGCRPIRHFRSVDLPQPLEPISAMRSPGWICRSTPRRIMLRRS
ncbi:hypothetical protein R2601_02913 [Salipiger bermudensis HTCC2601]|uniref:Uncharacterized protein n=1 Tax=Salipiger bermudensis (strain DSM 26914 / JCM 13377 / KCTC 12554 / HTCC2601) TaxID=314265 RepID=Q0FWR3_SALBH|nr:hypothetical protein R2601_02913 [Salipiger bermudensis HTCC2601]